MPSLRQNKRSIILSNIYFLLHVLKKREKFFCLFLPIAGYVGLTFFYKKFDIFIHISMNKVDIFRCVHTIHVRKMKPTFTLSRTKDFLTIEDEEGPEGEKERYSTCQSLSLVDVVHQEEKRVREEKKDTPGRGKYILRKRRKMRRRGNVRVSDAKPETSEYKCESPWFRPLESIYAKRNGRTYKSAGLKHRSIYSHDKRGDTPVGSRGHDRRWRSGEGERGDGRKKKTKGTRTRVLDPMI